MTSTGMALRASDVEFSYLDQATKEHFRTIERIDLEIPGQFVSIVGPSGCGKSTFLKIVNGLLADFNGVVEVHHSDTQGSAHAMVFQRLAVSLVQHPVERRVASAASACPARSANARAMPFIKLVGLEVSIEVPIPAVRRDAAAGEPSPGADGRSGNPPDGRAIRRPRCADSRVVERSFCAIYAEAGKTVLFITHQIDEAIYLSDRVIVMSARPGRILADIPIDLPRPRELRIKRSPEFTTLAEQIWELLAPQIRTDTQAAV
jgi:NitT/TauT family transport system ATP-binding protein